MRHGGAVAAWLADALGRQVEVGAMARLGGGSIQENWSIDVTVDGAPKTWVLRTDTPTQVPVSSGKSEEFQFLELVHAARLTVPRAIALSTDTAVMERPFFVMTRHQGDARDRILVGDPDVERWGPPLVKRLVGEPALLHQDDAPVAQLRFIALPDHPALARVAEHRRHLATLSVANPVLTLALDVLTERAPATPRCTLIHGDFRVDNVLVATRELSAILAWELARCGDPLEGLGWNLGKFWRFGRWSVEAGSLSSKFQSLRA